MMITLDTVAQRYGVLPSHLLREGSSIDMVISDAAIGYKQYLQNKSNSNSSAIIPELSQEEMLAMLDRAKGM